MEQNNYSGGASCSYANLGEYTQDYSMAVPSQGKAMLQGKYMVPTWNALSYSDLTSKTPSCSGYYNINSAYGAGSGQCQTTYRTSLCNSK